MGRADKNKTPLSVGGYYQYPYEGGLGLSQKEKELKRIAEEYSVAPLDLEDGTQLPNLMGWWAMYDFQNYRARILEEIADSLGESAEEVPGRTKY